MPAPCMWWQESITERISQLKLEIPQYSAREGDPPLEEDGTGEQLQKDWTQQPYAKAAQLKKTDKVNKTYIPPLDYFFFVTIEFLVDV